MSVTAWIGLGANLGESRATLEAACQAIAQLPSTRWRARSAWYRSAPVEASGPDFLNAVARIETTLGPLDVLDALQAIEQAHGRERPYRNAPRTLDLDLIAHGDDVQVSERLTLPHPRSLERAFVLLPLLELCPASELLTQPAWQAALHVRGLTDAAALAAHAAGLAAVQGIERLDPAPDR